MANLFRSLQRYLGVGKEKYFVGHDLAGNRYYQQPSPVGGPSRPKRRVEFKAIGDDHTLYHPNRLPPQWAAWLSFTRSVEPTIQELEADYLRQQILFQKVNQIEANQNQSRNQEALPDINQSSDLELTTNSAQSNTMNDQQERVRKWNVMNQSPLEAFMPSPSNPDDQWTPQSWNPTSNSRKDENHP
ncbi:uncharacterized protein MELLADRAFT_107481 [Melampsora larici-populina 98AG31]|uniref:NADH dehydrogenase [ubiquinone] 1 alpha subcomplex subunit n=1 Tax=Melampsora larici-populina (strain 98AG31 / pathotype 3-4-7) TaxID=747676 RepID=F4RPY7_MELLP|nr:uncharacterized protein MELLADRAFT_107481 [Melampsora larici-populina 98AG31]EGG05652.1 hypothetical protein MELLADRAFT_107481 [Melampsora larici-populina 98AG31]